jgi:hypothetical protein
VSEARPEGNASLSRSWPTAVRRGNLAFLAMTQHYLGHAKEAQAGLQRLREQMKEPRWAGNAEAHAFLREAEALLANSKTPGGK